MRTAVRTAEADDIAGLNVDLYGHDAISADDRGEGKGRPRTDLAESDVPIGIHTGDILVVMRELHLCGLPVEGDHGGMCQDLSLPVALQRVDPGGEEFGGLVQRNVVPDMVAVFLLRKD